MMTDSPPFTPKSSRSRSDRSDATVSRGTTRGSINLRIESDTRHLIDAAAGFLGKTRTEFMLDSARASAIDVLLDRRLLVLNAKQHDAFIQALDRPPAPGARLLALARRTPHWKS